MNAINALFHKLDTFIFKQIDSIEENPIYIRMQDKLSVGDDELRSKLNNVITVVLILIPIAAIITAFLMNMSLRNEIEKKQNIIKLSNNILETIKELKSGSRQIFSGGPIETQGEFTEQIRGAATASGIDTGKIKAINFKIENVSSGFKKSEIDLGFSNLTSGEISSIASNIAVIRRMKISSVSITKTRQSGLLAGTLHIVNVGRLDSATENE